MKWKVSMPRKKPADGTADYVLSVRFNNGTRLEYAGNVNDVTARIMLNEVCGPLLVKALPIGKKVKP